MGAGLVDRLARLSAWIFFAIGFMLLYEVVARYLFNAPTIWAEELSRLFQLWASWLAAAHLLESRQLIAIGILRGRLPAALERVRAACVLAVIALVAAGGLVWGLWIVAESIRFGRKTATMLDLPLWVSEIAVPVGCALLLVQVAAEARRLWRDPAFRLDFARDAD
ncbi:hypothetical protein HRbin39_01458 [bacterium HR39]|nr:hypothetical protein HRbin39_01458 [bacterium HR39]